MNHEAVAMWARLGAKRVVLSRELSIDNIKTIKDKNPDTEIEVFVHGAMCMAYSGRCHISKYLTGRGSNEGLCTHSCRWRFSLKEEKRPNEFYPVYEDSSGSYIYNSKDLCTINFLDKIIDAGVDGLKIEGRMKGLLYCATTAKVYKEAISTAKKGAYSCSDEWIRLLHTFPHRGYTSGFYFGKLDEDSWNTTSSDYSKDYEFSAKIVEKTGKNTYLMQARNKVQTGLEYEILRSKHGSTKFVMPMMLDYKTREELRVANPEHLVTIETETELDELDLVIKENEKA
jgi:putative protease